MAFILYFTRINTLIASSCGIFANILLLYFIFFAKKVELNPLKKILSQNCILDLCFSLIIFFVTPETAVYNNVYYVIVDGFLKKCSHATASILIVLYCSCLLLSMYGMAIPFYFRYIVICQLQSLTICKFLKAYGIVLFLFVLSITGTLLYFPPISEHYLQFSNIFIENRLWLDHDGIAPAFVATSIKNPFFIFGFIFSSSVMILSYALLIFFCIQISRKLKDKNTVMHVKTKQINKQIHRALIVQAVVPLLACNVPMIILFLITFFGGNDQNISIFCSSVLAWIPAANPLASLFIIRFYRRKMLSFFFKILQKPYNANISTINAVASVRDRYQAPA